MKVYSAKTISRGIARGRVYVHRDLESAAAKLENCDADDEIAKLQIAFSRLTDNLSQTRDCVSCGNDESAAELMDTYIMLLADDTPDSFYQRICDLIRRENVNYEYATVRIGKEIEQEFASSPVDYLKARSEDIMGLAWGIVNSEGAVSNADKITEPIIYIARDLSLQDFLSVDKDLLRGIVTAHTSSLSHVAILARNRNIPFLTGVQFEEAQFPVGAEALLDGDNAKLIINPESQTPGGCTLNESQSPFPDVCTTYNTSQSISHMDAELTDSEIPIFASIATPEDVTEELKERAAGIGLMRSEFLFMGRSKAPDENEQYLAYCDVLDSMNGKPVIVRTMDIGADKPVLFLHEPISPNLRGIDFCFENEQLFMTQLRALLRAAHGRNLRIMFPMIRFKAQVVKAAKMLREAALELANRGIDYAVPAVGIMVETPEAVSNIDALAELVDFVSIGTNDLTAFYLGIDRTDDEFDEKSAAHIDEILKLIETTAGAAHHHGIKVGICGELASNRSLYKFWIKFGIDELSVGM